MVENVKGFDFAQPDKKEQNLKLETFHIAIVTLNEVKGRKGLRLPSA